MKNTTGFHCPTVNGATPSPNPLMDPAYVAKLLQPLAEAIVKLKMGGLRARVLVEPLNQHKQPMGGVEICVSISGIEKTSKAARKKPRKSAPKPAKK